MSYSSISFVLFVLTLVLVYYIFPKKQRYFVLLAASVYFYILLSKQYIIFIIINSVVTFFSAKLIKKYNSKKKKILLCGIIINLLFLLVLKYNNFFSEIINPIIGVIGFEIPYHKFILPIGISYYTLESIGYIIDVYRNKCEPQKNYFKTLLYLIYFPKVIEGPISNYKKISSTLYNEERFSYENFVSGWILIGWGFLKKLVIADRAAILVNEVFKNSYGGTTLAIAIALYTLQIYADFSGCIDIVSGTSELFGVKLEQNFRRPFFSKSIQEFWRRWHITLGAWLKEYIFFPVSLSKVNMSLNKSLRKWKFKHLSKFLITAFPLLFVWLANGLWHGASWKYIVYGLYYYILMMLGLLFKPLLDKIIKILRIKTDVWSFKLFQAIRTIIIVCFGMFIFRCETLEDVFRLLNSNVIIPISNLGLKSIDFMILFVGLFVIIIVSTMQELNIDVRKKLQDQNLLFRWIIYYLLIFSIIIFGIYGPGYNAQNFIYGGF